MVSRFSNVSDSSSLSFSGITRCEKTGVKNRTKSEIIIDELINCGRPKQYILILEEVLTNLKPMINK